MKVETTNLEYLWCLAQKVRAARSSLWLKVAGLVKNGLETTEALVSERQALFRDCERACSQLRGQ